MAASKGSKGGGASRGGANSTRTKVHVVPKDEGWAVQKQGAGKATSVHETKSEAVEKAKEVAKKAPTGQVIIHKKDGTIQTEHTYGKDPNPPKG